MPIDTKKIILDSFTELFQKKGTDKVTVGDICAACGLSRRAFYYHFHDIPDVIQWGMVIKVPRIASACRESASIDEAVEVFVRSFSDDMPEINRLLASRYRTEFQEMLGNSVSSYLEILLERLPDTPVLSDEDRSFALKFYGDAICSLLVRCSGRSEEEDRYLSRKITAIIRGQLNLF